ncbi:hypothetical protein BDN72DRAFT_385145 [Pluteus cervinus]|uniref:Uncharacterized protein n=1 Tax=Pluteus cervinus TaxID=181527 RepID=A0ACD3AAB2_9AGAR|nr:hypothetical protein BDN72DRAFT_385145 [Pluteus cervinus]
MAICHCDSSLAELAVLREKQDSTFTDALPYGEDEDYEPFTSPRYCEVPPETGFKLTFNHVTATLMRRHRLEKQTLFYPHLTLMSMPLDIVLEAIFTPISRLNLSDYVRGQVFGHLHPLDLYHLGVTNRRIRSLVVTRAALNLWKGSFASHPEVPPCLPDMDEPQWSALLFGPAVCDECHQRPGIPVWGFRRRYCHPCRSQAFSFKITWSGHPRDDATTLILT